MKIHEYAERGRIRSIAKEIAKGVDIDSCDEEYPCTPLAYAIASDDADLGVIRFLIEKGADVNARAIGRSNSTVFSFAVRRGSIEKINFLLDAGADINYESAYNSTALVEAVRERDRNLIEVLNLLITKGYSTNKKNDRFALQIAVRRGRFDVVRLLIDAGVEIISLQWTPLMKAIALGTLEEVKALLNGNFDLTMKDFDSHTPLLLGLAVGDLAKAQLLFLSGTKLSDYAGARREASPLGYPSDRGKRGKTPLMYAISHDVSKTRVAILQWLISIGCGVDEKDESSITPLHFAVRCNAIDCAVILLQHGANPHSKSKYNSPVIEDAISIAMVRLLVSAGASFSHINNDLRQQFTGVYQQEIEITKKDYLSGRYRLFGSTNPEAMEVNFWSGMIRSNASAWEARQKFKDNDESQPVWSYDRFGRTITELPNGKIIEIGGEHEDSYDPDFCIYNDVVVYHGNGNFQLFAYPHEVFPPTDFHTATLVGDYIYIIGNLSYYHSRILDQTPVYRLDWHTFKIEKIKTSGDKPGWISRHLAFYQKSNKIIVSGGKIWQKVGDKFDYLDNDLSFCLDLNTLVWQ